MNPITGATTTLVRLPDDLLLEIFSFLSPSRHGPFSVAGYAAYCLLCRHRVRFRTVNSVKAASAVDAQGLDPIVTAA